jgi:hypothetical protein
MRALMNFQENRGWSFHILAEDCKTMLMGYRPAPSKEVLLRIIAKLGGSVADAEIDIRRWNRGSVWIDLSEGQSKYFGITSGKYPSSCPRELDGETKLLLRKGCEVTL